MNPQSTILWSSVALVLSATVAWWVSSAEGTRVRGTSSEPAVAVSTSELALGSQPGYPPGPRAPLRLPQLDGGIPLGDGSFLPPLNGVKVRDGIPPIRRDHRLPPPGPVVAKHVDDTGQEWWVHADGSLTSEMKCTAVARDDECDGQAANAVQCVEVGSRARTLDHDVSQRDPDNRNSRPHSYANLFHRILISNCDFFCHYSLSSSLLRRTLG